MATMNISLPDQMRTWVEEQVRSGRFSNSSDYIRDLIRRDQDRAEGFARLESMIEDGWQSGISDRSLEEIREDARRTTSAHTRRAV
jgi:antitoxin ParD1/3/4